MRPAGAPPMVMSKYTFCSSQPRPVSSRAHKSACSVEMHPTDRRWRAVAEHGKNPLAFGKPGQAQQGNPASSRLSPAVSLPPLPMQNRLQVRAKHWRRLTAGMACVVIARWRMKRVLCDRILSFNGPHVHLWYKFFTYYFINGWSSLTFPFFFPQRCAGNRCQCLVQCHLRQARVF